MSGIFTRRRFLAAAGAAAATAALPRVLRAQQARNIQRVVVFRFGGGVRLSETFAHSAPDQIIPKLWDLSKQGVLYTNLRNEGRLDHLGATAQILTGQSYDAWKPVGTRPPAPTIFEYYRAASGAPASRCLLLDPSRFAVPLDYSSDAQHGTQFGGVVVRTRLVGRQQMQFVMDGLKNPKEALYRDAKALADTLDAEGYEGLEDPQAKAEAQTKDVLDYLGDSFGREKVPRKVESDVKIASGDALTLYLGKMALKSKHVNPAILVMNFHGPDVAHRGSVSEYRRAVTELDTLVGEFWKVIEKNTVPKTTAVIITPDVGRDLETGGGGGFSAHRSGDLGCRRLFALILAPHVKPGTRVDRVVSQTDLCPTMGSWLQVETPLAKGKPLAEVA